MNKFIATAVASVMFVAAGNAMAERPDGPGWHGKGGPRGPEGAMVIEHFKHELRQLDLSDEQKDRVKTIMMDLRDQSKLIADEHRNIQDQLRDLIQADSWNEDAAAQLATKEGDLTAQNTLLTSKALADIYAQLTKDQRSELAANVEKRKDYREAREQ